MKLFDLLETAKETGDILINEKYQYGIIYSGKTDSFIWCTYDGRVIVDKNNLSGYKEVILSPMLNGNDWYLTPTNREFKLYEVYLCSGHYDENLTETSKNMMVASSDTEAKVKANKMLEKRFNVNEKYNKPYYHIKQIDSIDGYKVKFEKE